jgi:hypothetical protein
MKMIFRKQEMDFKYLTLKTDPFQMNIQSSASKYLLIASLSFFNPL